AYTAHPLPPIAQRQQWLKSLRVLLSREREVLIDAISQDFSHRSPDETLFAELMPSLQGIDYTLKHLKRWMKPSRRHVGVMFQPASAKVVYQPVGVVGVIVPWNYPLYLAMGPLI
ncbi:aldehyde dehydrogenase family protein, partial [Pseudomonas sp. FSL R10-0071]